jgi:hypothetical protein
MASTSVHPPRRVSACRSSSTWQRREAGVTTEASWGRHGGHGGVATHPFNRQENIVAQTCISVCTSLSLYGGFTSLPAMTETVAKSIDETDTGRDVVALHPWKLMGLLFLTICRCAPS